MKQGRRTIALILACLLVVVSLAACNSGQGGAGGGAAGGGASDGTSSEGGSGGSSSGAMYDASDNPNVVVHTSEPPSNYPVTNVPDTLTVALGSEPHTLYPQTGNQGAAVICMRPLYETLIHFNQYTGEFEPRLAERWEMIDDETIRLYLRKGVKCHAGYELTAEDVLWTAKQGVESSISNYLWSAFDVDNSTMVDEYTVDLKTYGAFGPILSYLADTSVGYIVNKQAYEEQTPEAYERNPTGGTGPYRFKEWIAGDRVVHERFEDYWGDKPYFKNMVFRAIPDDVSRALSLEAGEVDMIYGVDTASYQALIDSPVVNLVTLPSYQLIHFGMNNAKEPFNDPLVRKAIRYALDLDNMVNLAFSGRAIVADAPWPNSLSTYSPPGADEEQYTYNPEKARELLAEAGYADGFTFDLWSTETVAWLQLAEMMQNALAEVGITANVQIMDHSTLIAKRDEGTYDGYIARFSCSSDETEFWRTRLHSSGNYESNTVQYKNARVDELLEQARSSIDEDFRSECYAEVLKLFRQDMPWISMACPMMAYGIRSTLKGIEPHPYGVGDLRYIRPRTVD